MAFLLLGFKTSSVLKDPGSNPTNALNRSLTISRFEPGSVQKHQDSKPDKNLPNVKNIKKAPKCRKSSKMPTFSPTFSHLNKTTTYEDPRKWLPIDPEDIPEPRMVDLNRDPELGFGFVAGSEKPVIVRYVHSSRVVK